MKFARMSPLAGRQVVPGHRLILMRFVARFSARAAENLSLTMSYSLKSVHSNNYDSDSI